MDDNKSNQKDDNSINKYSKFIKFYFFVVIAIIAIFIIIAKIQTEKNTITRSITFPTLEYDTIESNSIFGDFEEKYSVVYIIDSATGDYEKTNSKEIYEDIFHSKNIVATEEKYVGKYILVSGKIDNIRDDSFEIQTYGENSSSFCTDFGVENVNRETILNLQEGQLIGVLGKCTYMGSEYYLKIAMIDYTFDSSAMTINIEIK